MYMFEELCRDSRPRRTESK